MWPRLHAALLSELRRAGLLDLDCSVDGSHVRALKGGDHAGPSPVDRARPGSKHHLIVDRHGTPLAVTGGNRHDVTQVLPLLDAVPSIRGLRGRPRRKPRRLSADRGYDFDKYRRLLWERGIKPLIARRVVAHGAGLGKLRWVVERAFAAAPVQTAPHPLRATRRSPSGLARTGLQPHMPAPPPNLILKRSVGYAEPLRPHLSQKRLQRPNCSPQVLIRDLKRLRQAQPVPAQPPEVENLAPVGCEVHIDLGAVVADETAPCPMNRVGVGADVATPADDPARTDQAEGICQSLKPGGSPPSWRCQSRSERGRNQARGPVQSQPVHTASSTDPP